MFQGRSSVTFDFFTLRTRDYDFWAVPHSAGGRLRRSCLVVGLRSVAWQEWLELSFYGASGKWSLTSGVNTVKSSRGLMLRKIVTVNGKGLNFTPQYLNN